MNELRYEQLFATKASAIIGYNTVTIKLISQILLIQYALPLRMLEIIKF